jgi:S1-C subfamily serine protease
MRKTILALFMVVGLSLPVLAKPLDYDRHTPVVDVVAKVTPSVVAIRTDVKKTVAVNPLDAMWFGFRGRGDRLYQEQVYSSAGSGIIVDHLGTVVTNAHVVADANRLTGTTSDGEVHNLTLIGVDSDFDIAILQIDHEGEEGMPAYREIDWGNTNDLMIGESVVVIGSSLSFENSVTTGVVSAVERTINVSGREKPYFGMIQTDAAINRGNSGGPLVNIRGELIGVTTLIASEGGGSDGIGFAIPVERVRQVYNEFIEGTVSLEERLGIGYVSQKTFENIDSGQAHRLGLTKNKVEGLFAASLDESGLAYQYGLRKGDLLMEIDGIAIPHLNQFQRALEEHPSGKPLELTFLRYDQKSSQVDRETISVPTDRLGSMEKIEQTDSWFGFEVGGITNDIADRLGVSIDGGVVIEKVTRGSQAAEAGLAPSDLIISINQNPIQTMGDFRRLRHSLQKESSVLIRIRRGNQMGDVVLGDNPEQPGKRRGLGM